MESGTMILAGIEAAAVGGSAYAHNSSNGISFLTGLIGLSFWICIINSISTWAHS